MIDPTMYWEFRGYAFALAGAFGLVLAGLLFIFMLIRQTAEDTQEQMQEILDRLSCTPAGTDADVHVPAFSSDD